MRVKNTTDIPDETIRELVRLIKPSNVSGFDLFIRNTSGRGCSGTANISGRSFRGRWRQRIAVSIAKTDQLARYIMEPHGGYLGFQVGNRKEALLFVLAHEFRHLWQEKVPRGWRVWGARGQYSERDADAYALRMLRAYRRGELK